jgi:rhamnosyltransferase
MNIEIIGSRGYPFSYASAEDMVREISPRLVRDGHKVTVHCWADYDDGIAGKKEDVYQGVIRKFHKTRPGKISGQFIVALKSSISAAMSDSDIVFYIFVNSAIFGWIPKLFGKKIFTNINGIMWKDPKWPVIIRHIFFPLAAYISIFIGRAITDSRHMQALYKKKFLVNINWIGYGCSIDAPPREPIDMVNKYPQGYYLIMSRITPHNLTDIMVDGFIQSNSTSQLIIAGHIPNNIWFTKMFENIKDQNVTFLGLVKDQKYLTQLILNCRAYLHGHSLGGINPALVRVTGLGIPAICVDTIFNREVVEDLNGKLQACLFQKNPFSVSQAINEFEQHESKCREDSIILSNAVKEKMSWEKIYQEYKTEFINLVD